jgi:hypothetical protein
MMPFARNVTTTTIWVLRCFLVVVSTILVVVSNTVGTLDGDLRPKRIVSIVSFQAMDAVSNTTTTNWWGPYVLQIATVYETPKKANQWCLPEQDDSISKDPSKPASGLLFVKNHKSASSTGAGITKRIALKIGERTLGASKVCAHQASHEFADRRGHVLRNDPQFLWTIVRQPTQRVLSGFFYFRAGKQSATLSNLIPYAASEKSSQLQYLQTSSSDVVDLTSRSPNQVAAFVKDYILDSYHFIAVADRMAESLVVLQMLLGLEDEDIIVLSSKRAGTYTRGPNGRCQEIPKPTTTPDMDHYLATEFVSDNYDFLLHAAADRSLDWTIDALGRELVQQKVQDHLYLQQLAETTCTIQAIFPCSANGTRQIAASTQDCYHLDWGCGYPCVDQVLHEYISSKGNE